VTFRSRDSLSPPGAAPSPPSRSTASPLQPGRPTPARSSPQRPAATRSAARDPASSSSPATDAGALPPRVSTSRDSPHGARGPAPSCDPRDTRCCSTSDARPPRGPAGTCAYTQRKSFACLLAWGPSTNGHPLRAPTRIAARPPTCPPLGGSLRRRKVDLTLAGAKDSTNDLHPLDEPIGTARRDGRHRSTDDSHSFDQSIGTARKGGRDQSSGGSRPLDQAIGTAHTGHRCHATRLCDRSCVGSGPRSWAMLGHSSPPLVSASRGRKSSHRPRQVSMATNIKIPVLTDEHFKRGGGGLEGARS
jgi:hypothetical protein